MVLTSIASAERTNVATMRARSPMEHLKAAALDVTLLVTTIRALGNDDANEARDPRAARKRWVAELKRAVGSYLKALWRSDDARFDASALNRCRAAADLLERRGFEAVASARRSPGRRLQRRLRRAMSDYARSLMRSAGPGLATFAGRQSAVTQLDARSFENADKLSQAASGLEPARRLIEDGVLRPMQAMVQDWTPKLPRSG